MKKKIYKVEKIHPKDLDTLFDKELKANLERVMKQAHGVSNVQSAGFSCKSTLATVSEIRGK